MAASIPQLRNHRPALRQPASVTMKLTVLSFGVALLFPSSVIAQTDAIRLGVLNDMSGVYSDDQGPGSLLAAQMAVEDFGGSVGGRKIEVISGAHQNKPDIGA